MKINKSLLKNNIILFLIFFIISLFSIGIFINVFEMSNTYRNRNSIFSNNSVDISISSVQEINMKDILEVIEGEKYRLQYFINVSEDIRVNILYSNYHLDNNLPIKEGRMFTLDEFINKEKVALIGEDLSKEYKLGSKIKIHDYEYEIIGILGGESHYFDNQIILGCNDDNSNLVVNNFTLEGKDNTSRDIGIKISDYINSCSDDEYLKVYISQSAYIDNELKEALDQNKTFFLFFIFIGIILIITVINVSIYYLEDAKKEFGVKKLIGYTNIRLIVEYILKYIGTCLLSLFAAIVVYSLFKDVLMFSVAETKFILLIKVYSFTTICIIIVSLFTIIPLIKKIINIQISEIIKGEE